MVGGENNRRILHGITLQIPNKNERKTAKKFLPFGGDSKGAYGL
jgi:hypothetical protein